MILLSWCVVELLSSSTLFYDFHLQPGVVVAIKYMSQTWTRGFGVKDVDVPTVVPDGDTIFRAASITKVMTVSV